MRARDKSYYYLSRRLNFRALRSRILPPRSGRFEGVNRYVIALRREGTLRNIADCIAIGMNASLPARRRVALYATGEHTYVSIMPLISKIKILFLPVTKESH